MCHSLGMEQNIGYGDVDFFLQFGTTPTANPDVHSFFSLPFADCLFVTGVCALCGSLLCPIKKQKHTTPAFEGHRTKPPPPSSM